MRDPEEGVTSMGHIRTGARRDRVGPPFEAVIAAARAEVESLNDDAIELHLYGSVATGMARVGSSDVDLVAIGVTSEWAQQAAARLSARFAAVCRSVEIGAAQPSTYRGASDETYGNRVFLRHYCVSLAGPDAIRGVDPFPADQRAARGFNGDIARRVEMWATGADARVVARKTLLAAAGVISIHDHTWTTDRVAAAQRWAELEPEHAEASAQLLAWAEGSGSLLDEGLVRALAPAGIVAAIARRFAAEVGLWS
jgi:hypothetical protein